MSDTQHHSEESNSEAQIESLLTTLNQDELNMPTQMLDRIKQIGRDEVSSLGQSSDEPQSANSDSSHVTVVRIPDDAMRLDTGARKMFIARTFVSVSAVVLLGLAAIVFHASDSFASLGDSLRDVEQADSVQLQIVRDGEQADVWLQKSRNVRWQTSNKKSYLIAKGSRLWRIDESTNTARSEANPWRDETTQQINLLALIGLQDNSAQLRKARAIGKQVVDGVECHVFRSLVKNGDDELLVRAFADVKTKRLRSIACWANNQPNGAPIAELRLLARNAVVDEKKFMVAKNLTEDGRIAKIVQRQGVVTLKPLAASRWTPIVRSLIVKPGDWIRTNRRGANAVAITLEAGHRLTLGPATLVEFTSFDSIRIHAGEVQIVSSKKPQAKLNVQGPNQQLNVAHRKPALYRVMADGSFRKLDKKPIWLQGFEGTSANESLGSLIANVRDGSDEHLQLSIGYHKVDVEIRDQIARTTIEESFVNHTNRRMEGVFHFPLPQDASISGFGMWIDGELVEADVVEKQRARQIYETILREKKDPALLEWTGGNIFKARVFPIEPHSEKRIRIVYTQVLPMRANRYRYSYGLRSEMLQTTPLRELQINVTVNSALPIKTIRCPTHLARTQTTEHSGRLEFLEQEYTPTRDFEVVCEVDARQSDVVVIPHQRGDDGYFMVQLTPPSGAGNWQRELLPDGDPMELLLVCDTSGSMDSKNRQLQTEFVTSVLSTLGKNDRFNIAVADVDCTWMFNKTVAATKTNVDTVQKRLSARRSLGWTDLDHTFASIQKKANKNSHVIYIGDGVVSARDADPQAFVARLAKLYDGKTTGTFHAVSVGSSFESVVLRAIARLGGGSVRSIDGEQTPERVSLELLNEIAQPGLRDINVEFQGIQVAAVYPERLPNLAAGTQQILIGRYLPTGKQQSGEIIVSGKLGEKAVKYSAKLDLVDAEQGNSFVPRLWARSHLDQLLDQGANALIKDEIIALSEQFHIITPFTSLLVLESDAQREQFGVKRRYEMRDGERFFADGRDNANFELRQHQMKLAGDWRIGLRARILRQLQTLGRDPRLFQQPSAFADRFDAPAGFSGGMGGSGSGFGPISGMILRPMGGPMMSRKGSSTGWDVNGEPFDGTLSASFSRGKLEAANETIALDADKYSFASNGLEALGAGEFEFGKSRSLRRLSSSLVDYNLPVGGETPFGFYPQSNKPMNFSGGSAGGGFVNGFGRFQERSYSNPNASIQWVSELFPYLPGRPLKTQEAKPSRWPAEAVRISKSLLRAPRLAKLKGGIEVTRNSQSFDPAWKRESSSSRIYELYSTKQFMHRTGSAAQPTIVNWADPKQRGVLNASFLLAQTRPSYPEDFSMQRVGSGSYVHSALHLDLSNYDVEMMQEEAGAVTLVCRHPDSPDWPVRIFEINTMIGVIAEDRTELKKKVIARTAYSDFVEAGGVHWPTKIEVFDAGGQIVTRTTQVVKEHTAESFQRRIDRELAVLKRSQLVRHPLPSVADAESAVAQDRADFEDRMVLMLRASLVQKWDTVFAQLAKAEELASDRQAGRASTKLGMGWIRAAVLASAGRMEDARQAWIKLGEQLVREKSKNSYLASYLINHLPQVGDANETMTVIDQLKPVFEGDELDAWTDHRRSLLEQLGKTREALRIYKTQAEAAAWNDGRQVAYARYAHRVGEFDTAYQWLRTRIDSDEPWTLEQANHFRRTYFELLKADGRSDDAVKFTQEWIALDTATEHDLGRHLVALIYADRAKEADALALKWMRAGQVEGKLEDRVLMQLNTAIRYSTGNRVGMYIYDLDGQWFKHLEQLGHFFMNHEAHWNIATNVIWNHHFSNSDEADRLRVAFSKQLQERVGDFDAHRNGAVVSIVIRHAKFTPQDWQPIVDVLIKQRTTAKKYSDRYDLGSTLLSIYRQRFRETKMLPFMRQRIADAVEHKEVEYVARLSKELFDELVSRPWTRGNEDEVFGLIEQMSPRKTALSRLPHSVATLHRTVDLMINSRIQAKKTRLQDEGHPEKLTRMELAKKLAGFRQSAREAVADRLVVESNERTGEFAQWCRIEQLTLNMQLERDHKSTATECWKVLNKRLPTPVTNAENISDPIGSREKTQSRVLQMLKRDRALAMLMNLAARSTASEKSIARLLTFIDAGIKTDGEEAHNWKGRRYQMLIALDKPDELTTSLRQWIAQNKQTAVWRRTLARLEAERGRFTEAIQLVQANAQNSVLSPSDHALMARWLLVTDDREAYVRSKIETFKAAPEYQLSSWINQRMQPWHGYNNQPIPSELDEDVLFAFRALFEKSARPGDYISILRQAYTACRDFRLLRMVPDAMLGRTPQQVYSFLEGLHSSLLVEVRNEATADEIMARVGELRASRKLSPIDQRALDLLECLVERRSSEVLNQPGPHAAAALAALQRAFKHDLATGEVRQLAKFLDGLGKLKQVELAAEQVRELHELLAKTKAGTDDHVHVAWYLANTIFWHHGKRNDGMTLMQAAIRSYEQAHPNGWPDHAVTPVNGFVGFFEAMGRVAAGEQFIKKHIAQPLNDGQRYWFMQRLHGLYRFALSTHATVSLGSETELLTKTIDLMVKQAVEEPNDAFRYSTLSLIPDVFDTAFREKVRQTRSQYQRYAFELMPSAVKLLKNNYQNVITKTANSVKLRMGLKKGIEFLIVTLESYPDRFLYQYQRGWRAHASSLSTWRKEISDAHLGDLKERLLAIVIKELKRDLQVGTSYARYMYGNYGYKLMWSSQKPRFRQAAEDVLKERADSARVAMTVARYFYNDLDLKTRAIEILSIQHTAKKLSAAQQSELVQWLHYAGSYGETISILEPLVEEYPDNVSYRVFLITAYARSDRPNQAQELIVATNAHFRSGGRWTETNIAFLADGLFNIKRYQRAINYYKELIPLHQRTHTNQGMRSYQLSRYYSQLARSHAALGHTLEAMDAAVSNVMLWNKTDSQRSSAMSNMQSILHGAKDLSKYIQHLDQQAEANGTDSPMLRRMCGTALVAAGAHEAAIKQFQLTLQLDPMNKTARTELIKLFDQLKRKDEALAQLMLKIDVERHNLDLYTDLINRTRGDESNSERAFTSLIESAPTEHTHHQKAAELRQQQNRWPDAIVHWKQVAKHQAFEPTGLLGLAEAQVHEKKWLDAKRTLEKLKSTEWPSRFRNVPSRINSLESRIKSATK